MPKHKRTNDPINDVICDQLKFIFKLIPCIFFPCKISKASFTIIPTIICKCWVKGITQNSSACGKRFATSFLGYQLNLASEDEYYWEKERNLVGNRIGILSVKIVEFLCFCLP